MSEESLQEPIEISYISIDELDIDKENIRGTLWEMDEDDKDLVESIKKQGILEPLLVRPAGPNDEVSYTIISGGRRYNAAIEANLRTVPCIIRHVSDLTAAGISVTENRDRKDIPTWKIAFKVIEWNEKLGRKSPKNRKEKQDRIELLATEFGCSTSTIRDYLDLDLLPSSLRELVKDPDSWSKATKNMVKDISVEKLTYIPTRGLSIQKAAMIARSLYSKGKPIISETDIMEVGVRAILETRDSLHGVLQRIIEYPRSPIDDIFSMMKEPMQTLSKEIGIYVIFSRIFVESLDMAIEKHQMNRKELIVYYVREGLKNEGYL